MIVDALGNPLALSLTGGNAHDITQAEPLAAQVEPEALLGDKGYDADGFIASLQVISSIIGASRHATRKPRATSWPGCIWSAHSLGSNDDRP